MISFGADVLYAAVNADAPQFAVARELVMKYEPSTDVVLSEETLVALYGALARTRVKDAASVVRYFRGNPNWRVVDVQSNRVAMNAIWDCAFANGEDVQAIHRRRLLATLQRNGVTTFYTGAAEAFRAIGCEFARNPFEELKVKS